MKKLTVLLGLIAAMPLLSHGQTSFTDVTATGAWNTNRWNNSADAAPYASAFTPGNNVSFTSGNYSFAGMGSSINVGDITVSSGANVNFSSIGSSLATGGNVRTITVGTGSTFDFQSQAFSTAAGTGFIKLGDGVLALAGSGFSGGFTLNAGTVIARGVDAFGAGTGNILTLNGGTVASNASRSFSTAKHGGGIVIGGNVQFGELAANVALASSSADLTFANNVSLGGANRTFTLGNNGNHGFSGVISNTGTGGITFAANPGTSGRFDITNTANTFTGDININGGEVRFTADGSLGNASNNIIIDGGRFAIINGTEVTINADRGIFVGDDAGTSISTPGAAGVLNYNGVIADKSAETGSWAKQGSGTLNLGGESTYSGNTSINNGTLRLVNGDNRLPTGTVVSLGQASSSNLGTLDLNGNNQEIAGLASTTGTNATVNTNVVTSGTAATLTINTSSDFVYGDGTAANSGIITGAISIVKEGEATQTFGGANTYTGSTYVNDGTLLISASGSIASSTEILVGTFGTLDVTAGGLAIGAGNSIGGDGILRGDLSFTSGANFVFSLTDTLKVYDGTVSFANFGFSNLIGFDATVDVGVYTLISGDGTTTFDFANISNFGAANALDLGGGKSAYFREGSLEVVVIPEPATWLLIGIGAAALLFRSRRRTSLA